MRTPVQKDGICAHRAMLIVDMHRLNECLRISLDWTNKVRVSAHVFSATYQRRVLCSIDGKTWWRGS